MDVATQDPTQLWLEDPDTFIGGVLGDEAWEMQLTIARAILEHPVVAVKSCHASGKSFICGRIAILFLFAYVNSVVWTTAPTGRQVYNILWREIRKAHGASRIPLGGEMLKTRLELAEQWFAYGFATDKSENFQGTHATSGKILGIIDEASGVSSEIVSAGYSTLTSEGGRLLMVGNPNEPSGPFFEAFKLPDVFKISIPAWITPNFVANGIRSAEDLVRFDREKGIGNARIVAPHLITPQWAMRLYNRVHGNTQDPDWLVRVEAEFPENAENVLISLALIENAQNREVELDPETSDKAIGVDPASDGVNPDRTAIVVRQGLKVLDKIVVRGEDTGQVAGRVIALRAKLPGFHVKIDSIGIGKGVYDQVRAEGAKQGWGSFVHKVEFGSKPVDADRYENLRAEAWGNMADWLREGDIPPDDDFREAANVQYRYTSRGRLALESKDDMKKRIGRSPDVADALAISLTAKGVRRVPFVTAG